MNCVNDFLKKENNQKIILKENDSQIKNKIKFKK